PALCSSAAAPADLTTPIAQLRKQVEEKAETDPDASVALLCMAIPRVAREYGEDSAELAWWVGSLTMPMIAYRSQFAQAIPLLQFAQPILEKRYGVSSAEVADIHVAYAWIYQRQGRNADAAQAWERALRIRERYPGDRKIELQKVLEAREHAERQLQVEKQLQAGIGQFVPAYVFLAQILERLDDFDGSEAASREAIRLSESANGPLQRHHFTALTQLGALLNARGNPSEALPIAQKAVAVGEQTLGPDAPILLKSIQSLADIHRALGQLPAAWHLYERMGTIVAKSRADVELPTLVSYYRGLAALALDLGNTDDAITALHSGLDAASAEPALALQKGYLMATLAQASTERDVAQSRTEYASALQLFGSRLPSAHPTILRVVNELCGLDIGTATPSQPATPPGSGTSSRSGTPPGSGTPSRAAAPTPSNCRDARSRLSSAHGVDPGLRASVYDNLSALSQSEGNLDAAFSLAITAVSAAEGLGTPDPLWRSYFRAGRALRAQGSEPLAIFFGKKAIAQIERQRQYFSGEDQRFDRAFLHDKIEVYRTVADWLLEAGRFDEGLEVLQLLKEQELYDFIARDAAWRAPDGGPALDDRERELY